MLLDFKRNVGKTDMIIRIFVGTIISALGFMGVFPGSFWGAAIAVLFGISLVIEGFIRY